MVSKVGVGLGTCSQQEAREGGRQRRAVPFPRTRAELGPFAGSQCMELCFSDGLEARWGQESSARLPGARKKQPPLHPRAGRPETMVLKATKSNLLNLLAAASGL